MVLKCLEFTKYVFTRALKNVITVIINGQHHLSVYKEGQVLISVLPQVSKILEFASNRCNHLIPLLCTELVFHLGIGKEVMSYDE